MKFFAKKMYTSKHKARRLLMLLLLICAVSPTVAGNNFTVHAVWFNKIDNSYTLRASLSAGPDVLMQNLLQSGYAVRTNFQLRFFQERRWLPDREIGTISWKPQIFYDSLLDRYTFRLQGASEEFNVLSEVLERAGSVQITTHSLLLNNDLFLNDGFYILARYDLETTHLPPPLQVSLLTSKHIIHSGWIRFEVIVQ